MSKIYKISLFAFLMVGFTAHTFIFSQSFSTKGTDFWTGFMTNLLDGELIETSVFISAEEATSGTVSIPGFGITEPFSVAANSTVEVELITGIAMAVANEVAENKGIHIVAEDSVSVYILNFHSHSTDASLVYPTSVLGSRYVVGAYDGLDSAFVSGTDSLIPIIPIPSELLVVAVEDDTQIEITPSVETLSGSPAGVPFMVTLNQGDVYQVRANTDVSGTLVRGLNSDGCSKNFGVYGGAECTFVGGCGACDHLVEQMPPVKSWGRQYVTVPFQTRNGDLFRIFAADDGTTFTINGGTPITINEGEFHEVLLFDASFISSNNPVMVIQYSRGGLCDGNTFSDPFTIVLGPVEQSLQNITFNAFDTDFIDTYFVNVVALTENIDDVFLDGVAQASEFEAVPDAPEYSFAQIFISEGNHTLSSSSGVLAYVYGFGDFESFGYVAGASLLDLANAFDVAYQVDTTLYLNFVNQVCKDEPVGFVAQENPNATAYNWDFGDMNTAEGISTEHIYTETGIYEVTLTLDIEDECTAGTDQLSVMIEVIDVIDEVQFISGCEGWEVTLDAFEGLGYLWSNGETTQSISLTVTASEVVTVIVSEPVCSTKDHTIDFMINAIPGTEVNITGPDQICNGEMINLSAGTFPDFYTYMWSNGATTNSIAVNEEGEYSVLVIAGDAGCEGTDTFMVTASMVNASAGEDVTICEGESTQLTAEGGETYAWTPTDGLDDAAIAHPVANPTTTTTYIVTVTDAAGCSDSDTVTVFVLPVSDAGTMPTDEVFACDGGVVSAVSVGVDLAEGDVLAYYLHDSPSPTLGNVLASNTTGTFAQSESPAILDNTVYYISAISGAEGAMAGFPDLDHPCTQFTEGTPVVFLAPVKIEEDDQCNDETYELSVIFSITGGLPSFDPNENYTVIGDFLGAVPAGQVETIGPISSGSAGVYLLATDAIGCSDELIMDSVDCKNTPIELLYFEGSVKASGNLLFWATASEIDNDFFILERSIDGYNFEEIARVAGNLNSTALQTYEWLDEAAPVGISYYKLTQIDIDGQSHKAGIVNLQRTTSNVFGIDYIQTPIRDHIELGIHSPSAEMIDIQVFNVAAQMIFNQKVAATEGLNKVTLATTSLQSGVYLVVVRNQQGAIDLEKVVRY